jgi:uncharacterized protein
MSTRLPIYIDPEQLAVTGVIFEGELTVDDMARLAPSLLGEQKPLTVEIHGEKEGAWAVVAGRVQGVLNLQCQRCMNTLEFPIERSFRLASVSSDVEAGRLPPNLDPLLRSHENLRVQDLIEDELLLALPEVSKHPVGMCEAEYTNIDEDEAETEQKENPFAVLETLKH